MKKLKIVLDGSLESGQKIAQAVHAAQLFGKIFRDIEQEWMENSNTIVILQVPTLDDLKLLSRQALNQGIKMVEFKEPDWNDRLTAICLEPGQKTEELTAKLSTAK